METHLGVESWKLSCIEIGDPPDLPLEQDLVPITTPVVRMDPVKDGEMDKGKLARVMVFLKVGYWCRFLREEDRARNEYPSLHYPEVYLLKGGYKDFFPEYKMLCEPQGYCPMHHEDYREELLKCRTKSKSWAGDRKRRDQIARLMKL
ncbi:hypothetical protein AB205_0119670 [Aquarana catesbeiana]|uniref:protein-tyrosine-phosphatase n=1 Tax=Aquarana catesbeiana TaxID=8400 RepID=A0A2G9RJU2_AQUCT|nr:hypothetical protein AB205_0119670 [Aquarana catesbeiana]